MVELAFFVDGLAVRDGAVCVCCQGAAFAARLSFPGTCVCCLCNLTRLGPARDGANRCSSLSVRDLVIGCSDVQCQCHGR